MTDYPTARPVPHPIPDPELIPPALDLSRPELAELMGRYEGRQNEGKRRVALVVQRPGFAGHGINEALSDEGWTVQTCEGPGATVCPLMTGEPCGLREGTDIAVIYVDQNASAINALPRLRCAAHLASPSVVAIEGSIGPPTFTDRSAVVGALRNPRIIIGTIRRLLARSETDS